MIVMMDIMMNSLTLTVKCYKQKKGAQHPKNCKRL